MDNIKLYKRIAKSLAQLVSLAKMYKFEHPIVKKKAEDTYKDINDFLTDGKQSIVFARSADILLINGERVEPENNLMMKFIEDFTNLDVRSIEMEPGITPGEFDIFTHLICRAQHISGVDEIKKFFSENKAEHLIARHATFKLVQEDEDVIKKGAFIKVEDI